MYSYRLTARREEWLRCNLPTDWRTRYRFFELDAMRTRFSVSSALRTDPRTDPRTPTRTPPLPQPYPNPTPTLPQLREGLVIKHNADQRYATDAVGAAFLRRFAELAGQSVQEFAVKADSRCVAPILPHMWRPHFSHMCEI